MSAQIEFIAETGSTNADLIACLASAEHVPEGFWLVTDRQNAGRGRQGRRWLDAPGNFMGSTLVALRPADPPPNTLSFVASLAVYETVLARLAEPARLRLKWPNDVTLDGAKFCGILLERAGDHAIVGIGVNLAAAPAVADRTAVSLAQHGPTPERDAFAQTLAAAFAAEVSRWRAYGIEPLCNRWQAAAHPLGSPLCVHEASDTRISGTFAGLEPCGALRLRLADGTIRVIHAGDVETGAG